MKTTGGVQMDIVRIKDEGIKVLAEMLLDIRDLLAEIADSLNKAK